MNPKQIKALKALLAKKAADRTEDEAAELKALQALAATADIDPETGDAKQAPAKSGDDDKVLSEDDIKQLIQEGTTGALKAIGLEGDQLKAISDAIAGIDKGEALTADAIKEIIADEIGGDKNGIDTEALVKSITESFEKSNKGVTKDDFEAWTKKFAKDNEDRRAKKNVHGDGDRENHSYPIEHRSGNLTVGQKQLANILLQYVSDDALAESNGKRGIERPTGINDGITAEQLAHAKGVGERAIKLARERASYGSKALTSTGAGTGDELVPTDLASELQMRLYLESELAARLTASELVMPTNPWTLPMITTRTTFKAKATGTENAAGTESSPGTAQPTLTAAKLIGEAHYSYESDEDSIIGILPMMTQQLAEEAASALEDAIINGDTTATQDSDASAGDASTLFTGLRKLSLAVGALNVDLQTGGISYANIGALVKAMGRYGLKPRDLLIVAGVNGTNDLIDLDETLTADKTGNPGTARALTGLAPSIRGIDIVTSVHMRENLNASGVYDGTTTTKGSIIIFHRERFMMGVRRGFLVEVDQDKSAQTNKVIASFRRAFQPKETPSATEQMVVLGYNYDA